MDARTFARLKDLLDGLSAIGLLRPSLVLTDSSGQSAGLKEARWAAETLAVVEECGAEPQYPRPWAGDHTRCASIFSDLGIALGTTRRGVCPCLCVRLLRWDEGTVSCAMSQIIRVFKDRPLLGASKRRCSAAGAPHPLALAGEPDTVRKVYSLQSEDGVRSYWAHLEYICSTSARSAISPPAGLAGSRGSVLPV